MNSYASFGNTKKNYITIVCLFQENNKYVLMVSTEIANLPVPVKKNHQNVLKVFKDH